MLLCFCLKILTSVGLIVIYIYIQFERGEALDDIGKDVIKVFEDEGDQESLSILPKAVDTVRKKVIFCKLALGYILLI